MIKSYRCAHPRLSLESSSCKIWVRRQDETSELSVRRFSPIRALQSQSCLCSLLNTTKSCMQSGPCCAAVSSDIALLCCLDCRFCILELALVIPLSAYVCACWLFTWNSYHLWAISYWRINRIFEVDAAARGPVKWSKIWYRLPLVLSLPHGFFSTSSM